MFVYGPQDGVECSWKNAATSRKLGTILNTSEPRCGVRPELLDGLLKPTASIRKLGKLASPPTCVSVKKYPELEDWVHESGHMVVIGEAAHPIPVGSVQACAMTVEDGAVLAKLFSHLRTEDQIGSFLWAFQDLRQPRCASVLAKEHGIIYYMTMPPGEHQEYRDASMRAKRDAGLNILQASDDLGESPEWAEVKEVFGYDAEDEADNWWVEWGLLRERSKGVQVMNGFSIQVDEAITI